MSNKELKITIKAVDEATKTIESISKSIESLGKIQGLSKLTSAFSKINTTAGKAAAVIATVVTAYGKLYSASKQNFTEGLSKIISVASQVGSALKSAFSGFIGIVESVTGADLSLSGLAETAIDYEYQMNKVKTITNATDSEFAGLSATAEELGKSTSFTAAQIAEGMVNMAQQGWEATEIIDSMQSVTALAVVGEMDMADASYLLASALNQFGGSAKDAEHYADVLTNTFLNSGATVADFGESLKYVGSLAGSMGISIDQVGAAIGVLGDNGIKGSQAGTTLRRVISNLASPTENVATAIQKYNLQGAQQKILNGDLVGGLSEMSDKLQGLNSAEKANAAYSIAGMYAMSGFLAIINSGPDTIQEMYEAIENGNGSWDSMQEMLKTVTGQFLLFVSKIQTGAKQIYDAIQENIVAAMDTINNFLDLLLDGDFTGAFSYLANESKKWGETLSQAVQTAIDSLNQFINGGILDSVLQIGTNIIQGICDGINKAYQSGSLTQVISDGIGKICDWITANAPTIEQAGKQIFDAIITGIKNNQDKIGEAMKSICGIIEMWVSGSAQLESTMGLFADKMITSFIKQFTSKLGAKLSEIWNVMNAGGTTSKAQDAGLVDGQNYGTGAENGINEKDLSQTVADNFDSNKQTIISKGSEVGTATSDAISDALNSMDTTQLNALATAIEEVGTVTSNVAQGMAQSFGQIRNSSRDSFMGMTNIVRNQMLNMTNIVRNQMVNMTNIVRNQAVNWSNIMRNQAQNARNSLTSSFLSMASVARTQMVNISNIVRNQAVSWSNIIRNQAQNARNSLTSSFMSMAAVARTQMAKVLAVVQSYMNQIVAATSKQLTIKVSAQKTITTTNVTRNVSLGTSTLALASTVADTMALAEGVASPSYLSTASSSTIGNGMNAYAKSSSGDGNYTFSIPLYLDGREVARATARYNETELSKLSKRNSRKRGE